MKNQKNINTNNFHEKEISILGTPCGNIKSMAFEIIQSLSKDIKFAYIDADHKTSGDFNRNQERATAIQSGAWIEVTDKINYERVEFRQHLTEAERNRLISKCDLLIVNGNHFEASNQIVVIDEAKPLEKKLHKITNPRLVILSEGSGIPNYLEKHFELFEKIPVLKMSQKTELSSFFRQFAEKPIPKLNGLIQAGGKSSRMGTAKSELKYSGQTQIERLSKIMTPFCDAVFLSKSPNQKVNQTVDIPQLEDTFLDMGPMGGLLSAMREMPENAWLLIACDMPYINKNTIQKLVNSRDVSKVATAFLNPETNVPEPLIAIWEPACYLNLLENLAFQKISLRKALCKMDCRLIKGEAEQLKSVNTIEEFNRFQKTQKSR